MSYRYQPDTDTFVISPARLVEMFRRVTATKEVCEAEDRKANEKALKDSK